MSTGIGPWVSELRPTLDGEEVRASVDNRLPLQLAARTRHLYDRLNAISNGEALFLSERPAEAGALVGHAVYFNRTTLRYERAIARYVDDPATGLQVLDDSTYPTGIVIDKPTPTAANLITWGHLKEFDFTNTIGTAGDTADEGGPYFLSGQTAGMLVKQQPAIGIFCAFLNGDGTGFFLPRPRNPQEDHVHYAVDLYAQPAGELECAAPETKYAFHLIDTNAPGWLPADDPVFNGHAPHGAKYGYNLALHPALQRIWPPLPLASAYLEADGIGVPASWWKVDCYGLWWFEDCFGRGPWPFEPLPCGGSGSSSSSSSEPSSSSSSGNACDSGTPLEEEGFVKRPLHYRSLRLYFIRMLTKSAQAAVSSLVPCTGSPLRFYNCAGEEASAGALCAALLLELGVTEGDHGAKALKSVSGVTFTRGRVASALRAGSGVTITPVTDKGFLDTDGAYYGELTLAAVTDGGSREIGFDFVAFDGAVQDDQSGISFLSFPEGLDTSFQMRMNVPVDGLPASPKLQVKLWVLSRTVGVLPVLSAAYRRLPEPAAVCTPVTLPTSDTALSDLDPTDCGSLAANVYIEMESDLFDIAAGDQVFVKLGRLGSSDGYPAAVGILRARCFITAG